MGARHEIRAEGLAPASCPGESLDSFDTRAVFHRVSALGALIILSALAVLNPWVVRRFIELTWARWVYIVAFDLFLLAPASMFALHAWSKKPRWSRVGVIFLLCLPLFMLGTENAIIYFHLVKMNPIAFGGQALHELDPWLGYRPIPGVQVRHQSPGNWDVTYRIGPDSLRITPQAGGAPVTIHVFGDSFIFGVGLPDEGTPLALLAQRLEGRANVRNYGVIGFGVGQMFMRMRAYRKEFRRGDIVLLAPITADLQRNLVFREVCSHIFWHDTDELRHPVLRGGEWKSVRLKDECGFWESLLMISNLPAGAIYQKFRRVILAVDLRERADTIFSQASALVKGQGARFLPLFIVQPAECAKGDFIVRPRGVGTRYASFLPFCPKDREKIEALRFPSDGHWSPAGARWAAHAFEEVLYARGLLPQE